MSLNSSSIEAASTTIPCPCSVRWAAFLRLFLGVSFHWDTLRLPRTFIIGYRVSPRLLGSTVSRCFLAREKARPRRVLAQSCLFARQETQGGCAAEQTGMNTGEGELADSVRMYLAW